MEKNWVKCFSVVTFDEDLGQTLELCYPDVLFEQQKHALAFLAFPDSNSFNQLGDITYVFRMKSTEEYLYGFVYFRLKRDPSKPRGFFQKSVVLLSPNPFVGLFKQVMDILGPLYFEHGEAIFEVVASCLENWGQVKPGASLELPMLGSVINYTVPSTNMAFSPESFGENFCEMLDSIHQGYPGLFQDINIYEAFGPKITKKHLWKLWEVLVTGESLVVLASNPGTCSQIVLGLISLISPLIYSGDFHPYFTVFDNEFRDMQTNCESSNFTNTLLGVTNPFFLKALQDSPNIFQVDEKEGLECSSASYKNGTLIQPCKAVISQLQNQPSKEAAAINNSILRRHFRELTLSLLQPFQQFLSVDQKALKEAPYTFELPCFSEQEFLKSLNYSLFPLLKFTTRPKAINLYSKFIRSSTFRVWFADQKQKASAEAHEAIQEAMYNFDLESTELNVTECKSLYKKIETRLKYEQTTGTNQEAITKLRKQLGVLVSKMTGTDQQELYKILQ